MAEKPLTIHDVIQGRGPRGLLTADEIHELVTAYWKDRDTGAGTMPAVEASYVYSPKIQAAMEGYKAQRIAKQKAKLAPSGDPVLDARRKRNREAKQKSRALKKLQALDGNAASEQVGVDLAPDSLAPLHHRELTGR